jgi:hypothetical protein
VELLMVDVELLMWRVMEVLGWKVLVDQLVN